MNEYEPESPDVADQFEALHQRCGDLLGKCLYRSAYQAYGELGRLARRERQVIPYIAAVFHQMDLAQYLLEPQTQRERAIELLGLLENEEAARRIQPDLPEWLYECEAGWRTACGYENLAEAAGVIEGFNSEGMHAIIAEGLQVCRRTGKLECVRCFREYATDVYSAADDLEIALHQCRSIIEHVGPWSDRGDRRWLASKKAAWFLLLNGGVEQAEMLLRKALVLTEEEGVGVPLEAQQRVMVDLATLLVMVGKDDGEARNVSRAASGEAREPGQETVADMFARRVVEGEVPMLDYRWDLVHALCECARGDWDGAIVRLSHWDRRMAESQVLHEWFETRLRLVAAHRLAGRTDRLERLAAPLREKATKACDWLTLRRLEQLLDAERPATPLALLASLPCGPFAAPDAAFTVDDARAAPVAETPANATDDQSPSPTPLESQLRAILERWMQLSDEDAATRQTLINDTLAFQPIDVAHSRDAVRLLFLAGAPGNAESGRAPEIWTWAMALATRFPDDARVMNHLATLGSALRQQTEETAEAIPADEVRELFRKSLRLDSEDADNFARAGMFYIAEGDLGEAERCFARGFRLQRDNSFLALQLAEVYQQTDRPRDALTALDMCMREGGDEAQLAWEAAMIALRLEQFDAAVTYLDHFEQAAPGEPNTQYYRGVALLELGDHEACLAALAEEEVRTPERTFHLEVIRTCARLQQRQLEPARSHLQQVLSQPLRQVGFLTFSGFFQLFSKLWRRGDVLPEDDPQWRLLEDLLLAAGLMPEEFFDRERQKGDEPRQVHFYQCIVRQPLGDEWASSPGCLPGQEHWTEYHAAWGVLAGNDDDAARRALEWQARCYQRPAEIRGLQAAREEYHDLPGVVWQGIRQSDPF